jgi:uncharacterized membrane protein YfcA
LIETLLGASGEYTTIVFKYIVRIVTITFGTLGVVYILGRMLEIELRDKVKNIIAVILMFIFSYIITEIYHATGYTLGRVLWETFIFACISSVVYVLIGWRLYARMDSFLDKKFGKDK